MNNSTPEKESCNTINLKNIHVVEKKPGMGLEDLIDKIREKTQQVLAEEAKESHHSKN